LRSAQVELAGELSGHGYTEITRIFLSWRLRSVSECRGESMCSPGLAYSGCAQ
jgi:hypothetical protein